MSDTFLKVPKQFPSIWYFKVFKNICTESWITKSADLIKVHFFFPNPFLRCFLLSLSGSGQLIFASSKCVTIEMEKRTLLLDEEEAFYSLFSSQYEQKMKWRIEWGKTVSRTKIGKNYSSFFVTRYMAGNNPLSYNDI